MLQQINAVSQTPTKPKVITIGRQNPPGPHVTISSLYSRGFSQSAEWKPATPPETPQSPVGIDIISSSSAKKENCVRTLVDKRQDQRLASLTPPNSPQATSRSQYTIRRTSDSCSKASNSAYTSTANTPASSSVKDAPFEVVEELEATIHNHPAARLYLDSSIIDQIRRLSTVDVKPNMQSEPNDHPMHTPQSRYSIFRPLSSHPVSSQDVPSYRDVRFQNFKLAHGADVPQNCRTSLPSFQDRATFSALRVVFPHAPRALLDSLQATYLALNYVSSLHLQSHTALCTQDALEPSPARSMLTVSSIPRKALARLGIRAPASSPVASTSWLRPGTREIDSRKMPTDGDHALTQQERAENLQISLRISVRSLLGEIEGRRLGKRDESLVRAVGEVVRCGQSVS